MWGRRRFSSLKGRLSFSEVDNSPPSKLKARLQNNSRRKQRQMSESSVVEPEFLTQSKPSMDNVMPDSEELAEQFEQVLATMPMNDATKETLRNQSDEKKWLMVQGSRKNQKRAEKGKGSADHWVQKMAHRDSRGRPTITLFEAEQMQAVFRTSTKTFLANFIEGFRGVIELNKLTDYYTNLSKRRKEEVDILFNIIESYRFLMNNEVGMKGVLLVSGSMKTIAMAMDYLGGNYQLTEKVVVLLSVACWWSEEGRLRVMEAVKYVKTRHREVSCFQTLVYLFEHCEDPSFKASVATFITTVCNTPRTIEQRAKVRKHFFMLDIIAIFDKLLTKQKPKEFSNDAAEEAWETVSTQYEVFVTMMRKDRTETVHKMIRAADADASHFDLANLSESWKLLHNNALRADCQDQLLNVVQALFLVPQVHSLAAPIYESVAKYVFEANSTDRLLQAIEERKKLTDPPELNFKALGELLKKKIEYDSKVQVFSEKEDLVKRQQKLLRIMQKRLIDISKGKIPPEQATSLQEDLIKHQLIKPPSKSKNNSKTSQKNNSNARANQNPSIKKTLKQDSSTESKSQSFVKSKSSGSLQPSTSNDTYSSDFALLAGLGLADTSNEIEIMKEREDQLKKEVAELQKKVAALEKGGAVPGKVGSGVSAGAGKKDDSNDPIKGYKGKLDSTGLVPAGLVPGKKKIEPAAVPKDGLPGSLQLAPIPVDELPKKRPRPKTISPAAGGLPAPGGNPLAAMLAARAGGGPKTPGPAAGGNPLAAMLAARAAGGPGAKKKGPAAAGGVAALFAGKAANAPKKKKVNPKKAMQDAAIKKLGMKIKEPIKPVVKLKPLFWNVIPPQDLNDTVWVKLNDSQIKYDPSELERAFAKKITAKKEKNTKAKETLKPEKVQLIEEPNRRQNIAISLKKLKISKETIKKKIVDMDESFLDPSTLHILINTAPNTNDLTLLDKYIKDGSDPSKLADEEQYLYEMSQIPNHLNRLKCVMTRHNFPHEARRIHLAITQVKAAVEELSKSKMFKEILEIVLAVGNYLNGGTARGAAYGYKLDILPKLIELKDSLDTNGSLMHYLYVLFERNYPHLIEFSIPKCAQVINTSFKDVAVELNQVAKQVTAIKTALKKSTKGEKFRKSLQPFEVKAAKDVEGLQKQLDKTRNSFQELAKKYAEKGNDVQPNTFFPQVVAFEQGLIRAGKKVADMREAKLRNQAAQEKKIERATLNKLKKLVQATKDEQGNLNMGLIETFKKSQSGNTKQVVDRFLAKYKRQQESERRRLAAKTSKKTARRRFVD